MAAIWPFQGHMPKSTSRHRVCGITTESSRNNNDGFPLRLQLNCWQKQLKQTVGQTKRRCLGGEPWHRRAAVGQEAAMLRELRRHRNWMPRNKRKAQQHRLQRLQLCSAGAWNWGDVDECTHPKCSMYGILFSYISVIILANVGKYAIHGALGRGRWYDMYLDVLTVLRYPLRGFLFFFCGKWFSRDMPSTKGKTFSRGDMCRRQNFSQNI